jgi:hypothetical protein
MSDKLDLIVKDLKYQLSFELETLDWDYFIETAQKAKDAVEKEFKEDQEFDDDDFKEILKAGQKLFTLYVILMIILHFA